MTQHANDGWNAPTAGLSASPGAGGDVGLPEPIPADVVFDFTGIEQVDVSSLSLLLTARRIAHQDHRNVWVTAVPDQAWHVLEALGLEGFFLPLPVGDDVT